MGKKIFLAFGLSLALLMGYGNYSGVNVIDAFATGEWSPTGQKHVSGGRTHFHYWGYGGGFHHK